MSQKESSIPSEKITAYVDNELVEVERDEIEARIGNDPKLKEICEAQKQVKKLVKECVLLEKAPVHLRARIRRSLDQAQIVPGFLNLISDIFRYHAVKGLATTCTILVLVALPWFPAENLTPSSDDVIAVKLQVIEGKLICVDCEQLHSEHINSVKHSDFHRAGLKTSDGTIWQFLDYGKGSELIHDFSRLNATMHVEGKLINGDHTLNVQSYQKI
ncbi:MAG: hypothetical protein DWQ05_05495 [Calditrichaeota bacterium]|nr:MAG: hypothetical protein DWQ05_05495 [Calditrichota bacterium]